MKSKLVEHLVSIVLLASLLGGCGGVSVLEPVMLQQVPISDGTIMELGVKATQIGLEAAKRGAPNTHIITDGKLIFALWPQGKLWGGACINCGAKDPMGLFRWVTGGRGMAMTCKTASDMVNFLVNEHGWTTLPATVAATTEPYAAFFSGMSNTITGFLVLPAGVFVEPEEFQRPDG